MSLTTLNKIIELLTIFLNQNASDTDLSSKYDPLRKALFIASKGLELNRSNYNEWYETVVDALVVCHIYTKKHDTSPKQALEDLITWNCAMALDPLISSDAQALIDKGYALGLVQGIKQGKDDAKLVFRSF